MRAIDAKKGLLGALCVAVLGLGSNASPARGAASDPLFVLVPSPPPPPAPITPPPTGYLSGPCGLGVDSSGRFYVSDYYHHVVDVFTTTTNNPPEYVTQLAGEDPLDGPCGLALDSTSRLYVNNFHRNVAGFNASPSFGSGTILAGVDAAADPDARPTGVAVDAFDNVYVDERTQIAEFDSAGSPVAQIGSGTLGDGYGVAVSAYAGTLGYLYIPDASTNTVKVYDPFTSLTVPKAEIKDPFGKPFVSLRDSAIAVDRVTGNIYFSDNTQPLFTEKPQAIIYVYSAANAYKGHLKYNVADALPPGLAVDNSFGATQGRVYVTSGNTTQAGIYAYGPGAATTATPLPPTVSLAMGASGSGAGAITATSPIAIDCASSCEEQIRSGAQVTLSADPDPSSTFTGWSGGGCSGTGECTVTMDEAKSVSAGFQAPPQESPAGEEPAQGSPPSSVMTLTTAVRRAAHRQRRRHHRTHHHRRVHHRHSRSHR